MTHFMTDKEPLWPNRRSTHEHQHKTREWWQNKMRRIEELSTISKELSTFACTVDESIVSISKLTVEVCSLRFEIFDALLLMALRR